MPKVIEGREKEGDIARTQLLNFPIPPLVVEEKHFLVRDP
jgi:hypothetical protein